MWCSKFLEEIKIKTTSATSGARPVAGYGTSCYRVGLGFTDINTSCKPPSRDKSHVVNPGVCNLTRYSEVLLAGARGFFSSIVGGVFHVKSRVPFGLIFRYFIVFFAIVYNKWYQSPVSDLFSD